MAPLSKPASETISKPPAAMRRPNAVALERTSTVTPLLAVKLAQRVTGIDFQSATRPDVVLVPTSSTTPPNETTAVPPLIVGPTAMPPDNMIAVPPFRIVAPLSTSSAETIS
jgi:hypothetical protein